MGVWKHTFARCKVARLQDFQWFKSFLKYLHRQFGLMRYVSYLCIVDGERIFAAWAARKIFLAREECLPGKTQELAPDATSEN